jgi:hypothetical protein
MALSDTTLTCGVEEFIYKSVNLAQQLLEPLRSIQIEMDNRFTHPHFKKVCVDELRYSFESRILLVGLNPSSQAKKVFDKATPTGKMVNNFIQLAKDRNIKVSCWNLMPGVTFTHGASDMSLEAVLTCIQEQIVQEAGERHFNGFQPFFELLQLNLRFISRIVDLIPTLTHLWALGRCTEHFLLKCKRPPHVRAMGYYHPGHFLRKQPPDGDAWLTGMEDLLVQYLLVKNANRPTQSSSIDNLNAVHDVPISELNSGGGPSSFNNLLRVTGIIVRSHAFVHGGGSIRLYDGTGFIDLKFIDRAAGRFRNVHGLLGTWLAIPGIRVMKIGLDHRRLAVANATHELVLDSLRGEVQTVHWIDA